MPLLNFQSRFAPLVESGEKRQTIRAYRKDGRDPKPGARLFLWTAVRTPQRRKLGEAIARNVRPVEFGSGGSIVITRERDAVGLNPSNCEEFAKADGFESHAEMVAWFESVHGLPFRGLLISWGQIEKGSK